MTVVETNVTLFHTRKYDRWKVIGGQSEGFFRITPIVLRYMQNLVRHLRWSFLEK